MFLGFSLLTLTLSARENQITLARVDSDSCQQTSRVKFDQHTSLSPCCSNKSSPNDLDDIATGSNDSMYMLY